MNQESGIRNPGLNWLRQTVNSIIPNSLFIILAATLIVALAAPALAQPAGFGLEETAKAGGLIRDAANPPTFGPATVAGTLVGYLLAFIGVIFFALMVYGGFLWMMARGNEDQVKKAKELIQSAIIGLAIVALAYSVTRFVLARVIGLVAR